MKCPNCDSVDITSTESNSICNACGFHTSPIFTNLSIDYDTNPKTGFDKIMVKQPKLIQSLKLYDDSTESYWFPIILNQEPHFVCSPLGDETEWIYILVPYKTIPLLERENYPDPNNKGSFLEYILDYDSKLDFNTFAELLIFLEQ